MRGPMTDRRNAALTWAGSVTDALWASSVASGVEAQSQLEASGETVVGVERCVDLERRGNTSNRLETPEHQDVYSRLISRSLRRVGRCSRSRCLPAACLERITSSRAAICTVTSPRAPSTAFRTKSL